MADVCHAYYPALSMVFRREAEPGETVHDYVVSSGADLAGPVICCFNGRPIMREEWASTRISNSGDVLFIHLPMDGGGDSDPLRMAAMIGVMALAFAVAPGMGAALISGGLGPFGVTLARAGIMMAGSLLVNAVMPVKAPTAAQDYSVAASSPTYSLAVPTNVQRIGQVIQTQYGRVMSTPPIISQPWSEYVDHEEFVHVLLGLGHGEFEVEKLMFDNLVFDQFPDVDYSVVEPGAAVPYHDNVFTSPHVTGQEIYRKNNFEITRSTLFIMKPHDWYADNHIIMQDDEGVQFSIGDIVYFENAVINLGEFKIDGIEIEDGYGFVHVSPLPQYEVIQNGAVRQSGGGYFYTDFFPSYYRFPEFVQSYPVFFDVVFPNGLYTANDDGTIGDCAVKLTPVYKTIDGAGAVGASATVLPGASEITITGRQKTPLRISISGTLPTLDGQGALVGLRRTAAPISIKRVDSCGWAGLRVNYPVIGSYPGITTLAIRAKASEGLTQDALSKIKVLSTRKLPIWDGSAWSAPTATRSIAWAAADACRNDDYSVGLPESRVDLATLLALDAIWTARGDCCDGIFDTKGTFWDGLKSILRTGRAQPHMVGGSVTFTRDQAQAVIKGVFTPRNIIRGTFSLDYLLYDPDTPDDVVVEYLDSSNWSWASKTCSLPGSSGDAPATLRLWGVTDPNQAEREGLYEAACNMYRRTFVTFQTELDARVILRGHLVSVSHPLPSWGVSGEVLSVSGQIIELSEPVVFGAGSHYLSFRKKDGTQDGPYAVTAGDDDTHVVMSDAVPAHVYTGYEQDRTHFQFGAGDDFERRCLVISATPKGKDRVELLCVVEHDAVHTADQGGQ